MNHILSFTPNFFGFGLGPFESFVPDFGQPEIIDIPATDITDLSDTI